MIIANALRTSGKHLRHARDHFELLLQSITSHPPFIVSYDKRMRNTPMETSVPSAREALSSTISQLDHLLSVCEVDSEHGKGFVALNDRQIGLDEPMTLNAVTPDMQALQTSFGRELWFAGLHAVHHWSMIRVIAAELVSPFDLPMLVTDNEENRVCKSTGPLVLRRQRCFTKRAQHRYQNLKCNGLRNFVMKYSIGLSRHSSL